MAMPLPYEHRLIVEGHDMTDTTMHYRIPDVALHCIGGIEVDPADLRGQRVAVFFCPVEQEVAAREIESYRAVAADLAAEGVWLLGVIQGPLPPEASDVRVATHVSLAEDTDGCAWRHFAPALGETEQGDESSGAAFFFERWGSLRQAWAGRGHATDILEAARKRG
jgi:hypothetical protein